MLIRGAACDITSPEKQGLYHCSIILSTHPAEAIWNAKFPAFLPEAVQSGSTNAESHKQTVGRDAL